jgi:DNA-binding NarL/FixJ family response regulator
VKQIIIKFGILALLFSALIALSEFSIDTKTYYREFLIAISALGLLALGFSLKSYVVTRSSILKDTFTPDKQKLKMLQISKREYEVLQKMAAGNSNLEIAEALFVSENTIKTHVSSLYSKLNVKRRTEAIKLAKEYGLLK